MGSAERMVARRANWRPGNGQKRASKRSDKYSIIVLIYLFSYGRVTPA